MIMLLAAAIAVSVTAAPDCISAVVAVALAAARAIMTLSSALLLSSLCFVIVTPMNGWKEIDALSGTASSKLLVDVWSCTMRHLNHTI